MSDSCLILPKRSKSTRFTRDELEGMSKDELIEHVLRLQASNIQVRNILKKYLSNNGKADCSLEEDEKDNLTLSCETSETKELPKKQEPFEFKRFAKRHILLKILYFGWDYQGFVCQEYTNSTIEHYIFEALQKTCLIESRQTSNYFRCGRTDKEVSAFFQVISIDVRSKFPANASHSQMANIAKELDYCGILNRVLPKNIQCVSWMPLQCPLYNARFDCSSRTYRYFFPRGNLNIKAMRIACKYLQCEGDFRNFCKMDVHNGVTNYRRTIEKAQIIECESVVDDEENVTGYEMYYLVIKANAFLWHQIRCIMAILMLIGMENEQPEIIQELLDIEKNPCKPQYSLAIAFPLNLFNCEMREISQHFRAEDCEVTKETGDQVCQCTKGTSAIDEWYWKEENLCHLIGNLQGEWARLNIQATMIRSVLNELEQLLRQNDSKSLVLKQNSILVTGAKSIQYKKLMDRVRCESLENRIKHFAKKQRFNQIN